MEGSQKWGVAEVAIKKKSIIKAVKFLNVKNASDLTKDTPYK